MMYGRVKGMGRKKRRQMYEMACKVMGQPIPAKEEPMRRAEAKQLRNAKCRCGSGLKFKRCCGFQKAENLPSENLQVSE